MLQTDIRGRVRNLNLAEGKALLPLFEVVVNSIHAIEDAKIENGRIDILVRRMPQGLPLDTAASVVLPIMSFEVIDNGIGFNSANFASFRTSDSMLKASRGAKGIGRFIWLKAFDSVKVESTFEEIGEWQKRSFWFRLSEQGIEDSICYPSEECPRRTSVELIGFKPKYRDHARHKISTISGKLIEHCLAYFISDSCPRIFVQDDSGEIIDLNAEFLEKYSHGISKTQLTVKDAKFNISYVKLYSGEYGKHRFHLVAHSREVKSFPLGDLIADLTGSICDEEGRPFTLLAYVSGEYFDENVNNERTDLYIPREASLLSGESITMSDINLELGESVKNFLGDLIIDLREKKLIGIREYVATKAPAFKPLMKHMRSFLDKIPPNLSDEKLHAELYKIKFKFDVEVREKRTELMQSGQRGAKGMPEFKRIYKEYIEKINDVELFSLTEHVINRRTIIDLLEAACSWDDDRKYALEATVHEIIVPMKLTSNEISYEEQNLWLIDERLSYHSFLSSDIPLRQVPEINQESLERPDVLIFNKSLAFAEGNKPFQSVVIIEFKKPMRKGYLDDENPIDQVYGYIKKIRKGTEVDKNGRPISPSTQMPFYCYIICDLTEKMREYADFKDYKPFPDNEGYFGFSERLQAYVEIISYDKLLIDAKKRNRILFEKLGLPDN